jgi:hypothetical protein
VANVRDVLTQSMAILRLSESLADRRYAATLCAGCAVFGWSRGVECDQAAEEARHEVGWREIALPLAGRITLDMAGVIMHYPDHIRTSIIMVGDQAKS